MKKIAGFSLAFVLLILATPAVAQEEVVVAEFTFSDELNVTFNYQPVERILFIEYAPIEGLNIVNVGGQRHFIESGTSGVAYSAREQPNGRFCSRLILGFPREDLLLCVQEEEQRSVLEQEMRLLCDVIFKLYLEQEG